MMKSCARFLGLSFWCSMILVHCSPGNLFAAVCTVPGSHSTVQSAVDDSTCTTINLASQYYHESVYVERSLTVAGPVDGTAIIEGFVRLAGSETLVQLVNLEVKNGCQPVALIAVGGAQVDGTNLRTVSSEMLPCPVTIIFSDNFESGNLTAWSSTSP